MVWWEVRVRPRAGPVVSSVSKVKFVLNLFYEVTKVRSDITAQNLFYEVTKVRSDITAKK